MMIVNTYSRYRPHLLLSAVDQRSVYPQKTAGHTHARSRRSAVCEIDRDAGQTLFTDEFIVTLMHALLSRKDFSEAAQGLMQNEDVHNAVMLDLFFKNAMMAMYFYFSVFTIKQLETQKVVSCPYTKTVTDQASADYGRINTAFS